MKAGSSKTLLNIDRIKDSIAGRRICWATVDSDVTEPITTNDDDGVICQSEKTETIGNENNKINKRYVMSYELLYFFDWLMQ